LPEAIRRQVNERLRDGEPGGALVRWLNSLPEVQALMRAEFGGKPVRDQNVSEWRQGGYAVWREQQAALEMAGPLAEELNKLAETNGRLFTDAMAVWLTARYAVTARALEKAGSRADAVADWRRLRVMIRDIVMLRRGDHFAGRLKLDRERTDFEQLKAGDKALESCLEEAKEFPEVLEHFRAAFELLEKRRARVSQDT